MSWLLSTVWLFLWMFFLNILCVIWQIINAINVIEEIASYGSPLLYSLWNGESGLKRRRQTQPIPIPRNKSILCQSQYSLEEKQKWRTDGERREWILLNDSSFRQGCRGFCLETHSLSEAAESYPPSPPKKNHGDEAPKGIPGLLTELKEHPEWHPLKGNYIIPLTKKKVSQFTGCEKSIFHVSGY